MCNEQAAPQIKDTLWGACLQTQTALLMLSILKFEAKTWQETSQTCKYELDLWGVIGPAVPRQIPSHLLGRFRNHRSHSWPLLATQRAWNWILPDEDFPWSWVQQLQAPTSHSKLPETFREKEGFGSTNGTLRGGSRSRHGHTLVQRTLCHSKILLFGQGSLSNMKGQGQWCLEALKSLLKDQPGPELQIISFFKSSR